MSERSLWTDDWSISLSLSSLGYMVFISDGTAHGPFSTWDDAILDVMKGMWKQLDERGLAAKNRGDCE